MCITPRAVRAWHKYIALRACHELCRAKPGSHVVSEGYEQLARGGGSREDGRLNWDRRGLL